MQLDSDLQHLRPRRRALNGQVGPADQVPIQVEDSVNEAMAKATPMISVLIRTVIRLTPLSQLSIDFLEVVARYEHLAWFAADRG